ncbi:MAG: hypothetical protein L0332_06655 [Chloroflexi bacterium]|nr:hypothetical protein [Chloroflexota bacterium]MCI0575859.1 hypothetical protein [Chloroflexota bacterium]MCI0646586.1 hypothetical protein [Chloroflexota bacterium]MCI0726388.1 hypothetical protein [Chloroflexota bacterium]
MKFKVNVDGQEKEIEAIRQGDRLRVSYDGLTAEVLVIHTNGPHFVLEVEEPGPDGFVRRKRVRAAGHAQGDKRQLWVNGRNLTYERVREGSAAHPAGDAGSLSATIPAVVSEILVQVGDQVAAGDKLILLESMKMVLPINAPTAGRVTAVHCAVGEAVQLGVQLVEIGDFVLKDSSPKD